MGTLWERAFWNADYKIIRNGDCEYYVFGGNGTAQFKIDDNFKVQTIFFRKRTDHSIYKKTKENLVLMII